MNYWVSLKRLLYLCLRSGGGHKSLIPRVLPLNPLNRFQSGFISFTFVVLNECEGSHCRTLQNFLVTQSLSHLITCQKKRFFASAQNDEKPVIASDSGAIFQVCHCERSVAISNIRLLRRFTPRNDENPFTLSSRVDFSLPLILTPHKNRGSIISIHSFISKQVSRISTPLFTPEVAWWH